jgi:peptidoglycan/LPS O-acetylase OafA/YrhL
MAELIEKKLVRFHQIDGLRAIAASMIVLHHTVNPPLISALKAKGYVFIGILIHNIFASGVDLFFVISGVVLLRPYLRGEREFNLIYYFKRRIQRLWPPYVAALSITTLIIVIVGYFPNWYSLQTFPNASLIGYFKQLFIIPIGKVRLYNIAWWSLGVEVIFYILVPLFIALILPLQRKVKLMFLLLFILLIFAEIALPYNNFEFTKRWVSTAKSSLMFIIYFPCFFCGIMLSMFDFKFRTCMFYFLLGIVYVIYSTLYELNYHTGFALLYFGLVALTFLKNNPINSILQNYLLIWVGERSYSIFLIHITVYYLTTYIICFFIADKNILWFVVTRCIGLAGIAISSMLIFYFLERYFARGLVTGDCFWYVKKSPN